MRNKFDAQLELLGNNLILMGARCEFAIASAIKAMLLNDTKLSDAAIAAEREIDVMERDIESLCMKLLLQQQPVAGDLRLISSALKMITDMERIGDQAADIAEIVSTFDGSFVESGEQLSAMANATLKMVTESVDAFVKRDLALAQSVIEYDDVVDNLFVVARTELISTLTGEIKQSAKVIDLIMIAKYLERIADHATNIAEWVEYSISGEHPKGEHRA
ncbi:MAG: phosphate signaling complex protein PhoU [Oscillospiraceae bacterium]